ncbi:hypothetical protein JTB14_022577 [Gonioctena quinquepunctata]|nr:hypothetical protein JTB14_022577 [Gonioctena quinquepunctata]
MIMAAEHSGIIITTNSIKTKLLDMHTYGVGVSSGVYGEALAVKCKQTESVFWRKAIQEELMSFEENNAWKLVDSEELLIASGFSRKKKIMLVKLNIVQAFLSKQEVQRHCKNLKGTYVSIVDYLTETRKGLLKHQKISRSKGYNAYVRGDKLIVNNEAFELNYLENNLQNFTPPPETLETPLLESEAEEKPTRESVSAPSTPSEISVDNFGFAADDENTNKNKKKLEK